MKVSIEYDVNYTYDDTVTINDNILRVFPSKEFWQTPIDEKVTIHPEGKIIYFSDRFGNKNARIKMSKEHSSSSFKVVSIVTTNPYKVSVNENIPLPLERTMFPDDARLYLNPSTLINPELIIQRAPHLVEHITTLEEALVFLTEWVTKKIEYAPKTTNIQTKAREALALGAGVCQDKSHIMIGFLRSLGVPARYVSGVLVDTPGDTHAWVEAYWPNVGWIPADPTHNRVFDLENYYVKFGHGRDYNDVSPISGFFESDSPNSTSQLNVIPKILEP